MDPEPRCDLAEHDDAGARGHGFFEEACHSLGPLVDHIENRKLFHDDAVAFRFQLPGADAAAVLLVLLRRLDLPIAYGIIYWWNPLVAKELINACHMDVIALPFIVVNTRKETVIDCEMAEDRQEIFFNFSAPFEIHDDSETLKRMSMQDCSPERVASLVPDGLSQFAIDALGDGGDAALHGVINGNGKRK